MPTMPKDVKKKVPPRALYLIVYACGTLDAHRTRASAELTRMMQRCGCCPPCAARIITYRRGSLFGRGTSTWRPPVIRGTGEDGGHHG